MIQRYFILLDEDLHDLPCHFDNDETLPEAKRIAKQFLKDNGLAEGNLQVTDDRTGNIIDIKPIYV